MLDDDDYPEEEALEEIKNWKPPEPWSGKNPWLPILDLVLENWSSIGKATWDGQELTLVTGGWSGNEDVLVALSKNFGAWSMLWKASFVGGKHIFGIHDYEREDRLTGPGTPTMRFNILLDKLEQRFPMPSEIMLSSSGLAEDYYLREIDKLIQYRWKMTEPQ